MGDVEVLVVDQFKGISRGLRTGIRTERRQLDEPKELQNIIIDEMGALRIPRGPDSLVENLTGTPGDRVKLIINVTVPQTAILYQVEDKVYYLRTDGASSPALLFTSTSTTPLWVVETDDVIYMGNSTDTWKIATTSWTVTQPTTKDGFHSYMYRGRRFVVERNQTVWFSDLNQPEVFASDSFFTVGGDVSGGSWGTDPGSVVACSEFEDYMVIFCTQSVWLFTGTTPGTFTLRRTNSVVGAWARDSVVRVESGILFFGGTPKGEMGVYLFSGNNSELVSGKISAFFRRWDQIGPVGASDPPLFEEATDFIQGVRWNDSYLLSGEPIRTDAMSEGDARQVYVYNFRTGQWSTFDNWLPGPRIGLARNNPVTDRLHITKGLAVYETQEAMCRAPGATGRFTLGWSDHGHTSGKHRFLAVKVSGWKNGAAVTTITLTARTPDTADVVIEKTFSDNVFDNLLFPLNIRGESIELEFVVEFATEGGDATEALIEQVQLIRSTKGEKVSNV